MQRIVWFLILFALLSAIARAESPITEPDPHVGDHWTYVLRNDSGGVANEFTITIVKLAPTEITVTWQGKIHKTKTIDHFQRDWSEVMSEYENHEIKWEPPLVMMPRPVKPGDAWHIAFVEKHLDSEAKAICEGDGNAIAFETVAVPAGSFDALKIERTIECQVSGPPMAMTVKQHDFEWYAPSLMQWVRRIRSETHMFGHNSSMSVNLVTELTGYSVKKP